MTPGGHMGYLQLNWNPKAGCQKRSFLVKPTCQWMKSLMNLDRSDVTLCVLLADSLLSCHAYVLCLTQKRFTSPSVIYGCSERCNLRFSSGSLEGGKNMEVSLGCQIIAGWKELWLFAASSSNSNVFFFNSVESQGMVMQFGNV